MDFKMDRKWIVILGLILCGTFMAMNAYDRVLTSRHIIWCGMTILLCLKKTARVGVIHLLMAGYLIFAMFSGKYAVNQSEWLYSTLKIVLMLSFLSVADIDIKSLSKTMIVLGIVFVGYFWYDYSMIGDFGLCRGLMRMKNYWAAAHFFVLPFCYYAIKNKFWHKTAFAVACMMVLNIVLLNTRSVILALGTSMIALAIADKQIRWKLIGVSLVCAILALTAKPQALLSSSTFEMRLIQWAPTLDMIVKNPFGVGNGNWWMNFPAYAPNMDFENAFVTQHFRFPHNDFLWVWAEVGILGFLCYMGMFVVALKKAKPYLLMGLTGYITIACFCSLRERAFSSLMLCIFLSLVCKRKWAVKPRYLVIPLLFFMVVLGFRYRSSCWNKKLIRSQNIQQVKESTEGFSVFSTVDYTGLPYHWWRGMAQLRTGEQELAVVNLKKAYKYNPNSIQTINGMGIVSAIEGDMESSKKYFKEALRIRPDFKDAKMNLERTK
jgi:hypothetical protein